jgi:ecotin
MKKILVLSLVAFATASFAQVKSNVNGYPKPDSKSVQKVITLAPIADEDSHYVEIMVGKKTTTDACNTYVLQGELKVDYAQDSHNHFYKFTTDGTIMSSAVGCLDTKTFEKVAYAQSENVKYDSKNPIVVYVPKGYEVDYKIWSSSKINKAK